MPAAITGTEGSVIFDATIMPHRSLSRVGRRWLALSLAGLCAVIGLRFWLLGAWPVIAFCGVEIGLVLILLHLHHRAARATERLLLTVEGLLVIRTSPGGRRTEVAMQGAWLNVVLEEHEGRVPRLLLGQRSRRMEVGAALGEVQKRDLAAAIRDALFQARNPRFDNAQLS